MPAGGLSAEKAKNTEKTEDPPMRYRKRRKAASQTMAMAVLVVAALAVLFVLVCSRVFIVRNIMIVGNRNLLQEEIITQSGVQVGDNLLGISSARLKEQLEQNRYIEYVGRDFDYQGTLTIRINERLGMAVVNAFGLYYVLDASGMVLECTGSVYPDTVSGPKVSGFAMDDHSRVVVGDVFPVQDKEQLEQMEQVLRALDSTGLLGRISLLDVKNLDNLYAMTTDGAKIMLGDNGDLTTKLLIAREVLAVREPMGSLQGAEIDVSSGKNAHYIPDALPTITPVPTATPVPGATQSPA